MRRIRAIVLLILSAALFWALDNRHGTFPALGKLLSPFTGFWQNGRGGDSPPESLIVPGLSAEVQVVWDDRHVPHIFASSDHDLYLAQGYVAASLRLWQMEFQALYTAGRISEVVGPVGLGQDRINRRLGFPAAAERALAAFEREPKTREAIESFTAGVNAYIRSLRRKDLPVEYKILDYRPEPWTPFKCALLLKAMAHTLTFHNQDALMTAAREALGEEVLDRLFPVFPPLTPPVVPDEGNGGHLPRSSSPPRSKETESADTPAAPARIPAIPVGSAEGMSTGLMPPGFEPGPSIGSNNWAVSGRLTRDGFPILCNDMHLGLSLPAIWYEVQLTAPGVNVRGVAFPGAPLVIAGTNENIAWGFTNAGSDVLDWYRISFRDESRAEYLHAGEWRKTWVREERIKVRGGGEFIDRVVWTDYGPIVRGRDEPASVAPGAPPGAALRWLAHDPSNEFLTLYALNRARGYDDYVKALETWDCPAQNIVYADREGTVAITHNGKFPLRRPGQGRYVLDGSDPRDHWGGWVPRDELPRSKDPARGFVSSANQLPAGPSYPHYLGWDYAGFERAARINEILASARDITPSDMVRMQADVIDLRARTVVPRLVELIGDAADTEAEKLCLAELESWSFEARAALIAPTVFRALWTELNRAIWDDEKRPPLESMPWPSSEVTASLLLLDPEAEWFDDKTTVEKETAAEISRRAFRSAVSQLEKRLGPFGEGWRWGRVKATRIAHLARLPGFGRELPEADGVGHVINAIDVAWAPSWRMVVQLGPEIKAWGTYPGGQSGNPGSRFYESFVDDWAAGRPAELLFLRSAEERHPSIAARTVMRSER